MIKTNPIRNFSIILIATITAFVGCEANIEIGAENNVTVEIDSLSDGTQSTQILTTKSAVSASANKDNEEVNLQEQAEGVPGLLPATNDLDPADWKNWPIIPILTENVQTIYNLGQELGRISNGFSIFGDCQSTPESFLGLYDFDQSAFDALPENLQNTILYFGSSLTRESPTAKPGTTTGALLWAEWHETKYGCLNTETPIQCELRLNNPSFVLLAVGTHYESRNEYYLRKIIEELLSLGIVPILSTKADNREGDHSINLQTAQLAAEYNIPMWNFWALSKDLPENGLYVKDGEEHLGAIYFIDELKDRHRLSALETLTAIWTAATNGK